MWIRGSGGCVVAVLCLALWSSAGEIPPIARRLPPPGIELAPVVQAELAAAAEKLTERLAQAPADHPLLPDAAALVKAVQLAVKYGEFYRPQDADVARQVIALANERLDQLLAGQTPWTAQRGNVIRGFRSRIDDSPQPYGLTIPEGLDLSKPVPLYIWLHGRGDTTTDLHFIARHQTGKKQVSPNDAIVVHPLGRQCLGYKSAGETDVLEAVQHVQSQYKIDPNRIVLMGFSMGGAGTWHLGAHYADRWVAMSPGAGFAETARYQKLKPADFPPWYEQTLWGLYDVPGYVHNLFNLPVVAYSGEVDPQKQAADVMEQAFAVEGRQLTHLIGPGMGHQYHPDVLKDILARIKEARDKGRDPAPKTVSLQTRTLRYPRMFWVEVLLLGEHWQDTRVDAAVVGPHALTVTTKNVNSLRLIPPVPAGELSIAIDGQTVEVKNGPESSAPVILSKTSAGWRVGAEPLPAGGLAKRHGLSGPIDDVFYEPFLVVTPTGSSPHASVEQWVDFERAHFEDRWQALYRGRLRMKPDNEVTPEDMQKYHLILWGDPASNRLLGQIRDRLPIRWTEKTIEVGDRKFDSATHVPALIYPNPLAPGKYVVLNSGPTFREGHDRTNSLQNPKLPDWAIVDLSQPPNELTPGKIAAADFFDERWQLRPRKQP